MESKEFSADMQDPRYRFAYEVLKQVMIIRGETRLARVKNPPPAKVLFTKEHAEVLQTHLVTNGKAQELDNFIQGKQCDYTDGFLRELMDEHTDRYLSQTYSDSLSSAHSFICTCGDIAYTGAYFKNKPKAQNAAINYIRELVRGIPEDSNIFTNCNFTPSE